MILFKLPGGENERASKSPQLTRKGGAPPVRGTKELCMVIPVSSLIDLRYTHRLLESTLEQAAVQLWAVPVDLEAAHQVLGGIIDGYAETFKLLDYLQAQNGLGPKHHHGRHG